MSGRIVRRSAKPRPATVALGLLACVATSLVAGAIGVLLSVHLLVAETEWGRLPAALWAMRSQPGVALPFLACFAFALLLTMAAFGGAMIIHTRQHGDAHWTQVGAVRQAKLHDQEAAMLLDRLTRTLRRLGGSEPTAYTGRGGAGGVLPNLLTWPGSVVVLDVDGENWERTAGFRSKHLHHKTLLFNPLDSAGHSCRYNPLGHIDRHNPVEVIDELEKIGAILLAPPRTGSRAWTERARTAFLGVAAYLAATVDDGEDALPFTIGEIYRQFTTGDAKRRFPAIIEQREAAGRPLPGACVSALRDWFTSSDAQFTAVRQTVVGEISLWLNPYVDAATAASDVDLRTMRDARISLYLGVAPEDVERVAPIHDLLCRQLIDLNLRALPTGGPAGGRHPIPLLLLLDDAARLGRACAGSGGRDLASYGIRLASNGRPGSPPTDRRDAPAVHGRAGAFGATRPIPAAPDTDGDGVLLLRQAMRDPQDGAAANAPLRAPHMLAIRPDSDGVARSLRVIAKAEAAPEIGQAAAPRMASPPARDPAPRATASGGVEDGLDHAALEAAMAAPAGERITALFEHIVRLAPASA